MNGQTAEKIAEAFHEVYERRAPEEGYETRKESAVPWADVPEENRKLMVAVVEELLHREVIGLGAPDVNDDPEWRRAYARVAGEDAQLVQEFHDTGMGWLANRVLHPFGWALGVVVNDEMEIQGLGIQKTSDSEGIVTPLSVEIPARLKFMAAVGRPLPKPKDDPEGVVPTGCPICGRPRYRKLANGDGWPPEGQPHTYVSPHPLSEGVVAVACGNPRCPAYEAMQRPV